MGSDKHARLYVLKTATYQYNTVSSDKKHLHFAFSNLVSPVSLWKHNISDCSSSHLRWYVLPGLLQLDPQA